MDRKPEVGMTGLFQITAHLFITSVEALPASQWKIKNTVLRTVTEELKF